MPEVLDMLDDLSVDELRTVIHHSKSRIAILQAPDQASVEDAERIATYFLNAKDVWEGDISTVYDAGHGLVVIPSVIEDKNKSGAHQCIQATVSEESEAASLRKQNYWMWDSEAPTFRFAKTVKIGPTRRSVAVHQLVDELFVAFHSRSKKAAGAFHERDKSTSYVVRVGEDGDIDMDPVPMEWNNLPLPPEGGNL